MTKTILLTGATDGIGLETAKLLANHAGQILLHGRNTEKLQRAQQQLLQLNPKLSTEIILADLSDLAAVAEMADAIKQRHQHIDVVINNAGVFKTSEPLTRSGYDVRLIINTVAPYLLTLSLLPLMNGQSRVVNVASAAQAPISLAALRGEERLSDSAAYAQSKLALISWTHQLAHNRNSNTPVLLAINPASFLGSKMVKEAYGSAGRSLSIGAEILLKAAVDDEFSRHSGQYFDNDSGEFAAPHPDALRMDKNQALLAALNEVLHAHCVSV